VLDRVTGAWNNQTTWNTKPTVTATTVTCPPVDNTYVDEPLTTPPNAPQPYAITGLESLVQGWMATPALNYGVQLSVTSNLNFRFASSEYTTVAVRPELEVTYTTTPPPGPPTVTVTAPPATSTTSPITVSGTASATAPATVTQVTWSNAQSFQSGVATGTTNWSASIPLVRGANDITITVTDSNGATGTTTFTVAYNPPPRTTKKKDNEYCGFGAAGSSSSSLAIGALALALLGVAVFVRKG
jgi:hypothetical protein